MFWLGLTLKCQDKSPSLFPLAICKYRNPVQFDDTSAFRPFSKFITRVSYVWASTGFTVLKLKCANMLIGVTL